ncbi:MAG: PQQ-binding-like beta-propeller repeat protein [Candidatus Saliniplasma sp.]
MEKVKNKYIILIVVILVVSFFTGALIVSGSERAHPGRVVWDETRVEGFSIGEVSHLNEEDNIVYSISSGGRQLVAVDVEDNEILWHYDHYYMGLSGEELRTQITVTYESDDVVYLGDQMGNIVALDAENGEELWRSTPSRSARFYSLHVSEGKLFTGGYDYRERSVWVLDVENGEEMMNHTYGSSVFSVYSEDGVVYSAHSDGQVIAVDSETGEKLWEHSRHGEEESVWSLYVQDGIVYSVGGHEVIAYDAEKEEKIWEHQHHSEREIPWIRTGISTVHVEDDIVYSGWGFNEVVAAEIENGEEIWTYEHSSPVRNIQTNEDELFIVGRNVMIREKEGDLILGMSRTLRGSISSLTGWLMDYLWLIIVGLALIGVALSLFLIPPKRFVDKAN